MSYASAPENRARTRCNRRHVGRHASSPFFFMPSGMEGDGDFLCLFSAGKPRAEEGSGAGLPDERSPAVADFRRSTQQWPVRKGRGKVAEKSSGGRKGRKIPVRPGNSPLRRLPKYGISLYSASPARFCRRRGTSRFFSLCEGLPDGFAPVGVRRSFMPRSARCRKVLVLRHCVFFEPDTAHERFFRRRQGQASGMEKGISGKKTQHGRYSFFLTGPAGADGRICPDAMAYPP